MFHLHEVTSISQSTVRLCGLFFCSVIGGGIIRHSCCSHLSSDAVPLFDCRSWKSSQIYMTGLSMKELILIATYYQSAMSLNTIISCYEGQPLNKTSGFSVNTTLTMARGVFDLLERHWRV